MTPDEKKRIAKIYVNVGYALGRNITPEMAILFVDSVSDLDASDVEAALIHCFKNESYLPTPARIRSHLGLIDCDEDVGTLVSAEIFSAISKFGWCNADRAREYLGEFAWSVVERFGGWENICQNTSSENSVGFRAQVRRLADAMHARRNGVPVNEGLAHEEAEQLEYDDEQLEYDNDNETCHYE